MSRPPPNPLPAPDVSPPVTAAQVLEFAIASGDDNPIHLSPEAARSAGLEGPVLHGMFIAGRLEIFLEQFEGYDVAELKVNFVRPVPVGAVLAISSRHIPAEGPHLRLRLLVNIEGGSLAAVAEARLVPASGPAS